MVNLFTTGNDFSLYGQVDDEVNVLAMSTNTSNLEIRLESVNRTTLDRELDDAELFRIAFVDPKTNIIQRHIDFDLTILKEDKEIFRLSNNSVQSHIPFHSSRGWEIIPVVIGNFTKSGEYIFRIVVEGISFYPISPEEAEFRIQY
jgi:hypothetical protein